MSKTHKKSTLGLWVVHPEKGQSWRLSEHYLGIILPDTRGQFTASVYKLAPGEAHEPDNTAGKWSEAHEQRCIKSFAAAKGRVTRKLNELETELERKDAT